MSRTPIKEETLLKEFTKSKVDMYSRLQLLKKFGVLKDSLTSTCCTSNKELLLNENPNPFEVLEFYGDSVLYERITRMLVETRKFCRPHILSTMRKFCIQNKTLAVIYDSLALQRLSPIPISSAFLSEKQKGDIVESIVGELAQYETQRGHDGMLLDQCKQALDELIAYILYAGESAYFFFVHKSQREKLGDQQQNVDQTQHQNVNKTQHQNVDQSKHQNESSGHQDTSQKFNGSCFNCGLNGHMAKDCTSHENPVNVHTKLVNEVKKKRKKKTFVRETRIRRTFSKKFSPIRQARSIHHESNEEEVEELTEENNIEQKQSVSSLLSPSFFKNA